MRRYTAATARGEAGWGRRSAGPSCPDDCVKRVTCPQKHTHSSHKTRPGLPASFLRGKLPRHPRRDRGGSARSTALPRSHFVAGDGVRAGGGDWLAGAAYRGATPRGCRGSTTRCRGPRRRGRPGSRPAAPQSCRGKEDMMREHAPTTTSASRPQPLSLHWYWQRHHSAPTGSHPCLGDGSPLFPCSESQQPSELAAVSHC